MDFNPARIAILQADITVLEVDAIVNAANSSLLGGGGVDGAIHRAAGPDLLQECRRFHGCPTGEVRVTDGYRLPAKRVIHTVGPIWRGGDHDEDRLLSACYSNCLIVAAEEKLNSIAFPAISTGIYGFPFERACGLALEVTMQFLKAHVIPHTVIFTCFSDENFQDYTCIYHQMLG